jgi:hypothetical protein
MPRPQPQLTLASLICLGNCSTVQLRLCGQLLISRITGQVPVAGTMGGSRGSEREGVHSLAFRRFPQSRSIWVQLKVSPLPQSLGAAPPESCPMHSPRTTSTCARKLRSSGRSLLGSAQHRNVTAFCARVRLDFGRFLQVPRLRRLHGLRSRSHNSLLQRDQRPL